MFFHAALSGQDYRSDTWQVKDGLPQNTISEIIQTRDGYIWIGTEGGLSRFDGVRFTNFDLQNTPAMASNRISRLYENSNGDLLIATSENLVVCRDGKFSNLSALYNYTFDRVVSILKKNDDELILLSNLGHNQRIDSRTYQPIERNPEEKKELERPDFSVSLLGTGAQPKDWNNVILKKDLQDAIFESEAIMINADSLIFWYAVDDRLTLFKGFEILKIFSLAPYFKKGSKSILLKSGSIIYVLDREGKTLLEVNEETSEIVHRAIPALCVEGSLTSFLIDQEANLWLGSTVCGLIKIKPNRFTYIDSDSLSFKRNIYPVFRGSDGRILIGSSDDGILAYDSTYRRLPLPPHPALTNRYITSIAEHEGNYYLSGLMYNAIFRLEATTVTPVHFVNDQYTQVNALYTNKEGRLLVGAHEGLYEMVGDSLEIHSLSEQKFVRLIMTLFEDRDSLLWVLTTLNAFKYNQKTDEVLLEFKERWPHIQEYRGAHQDPEGRMYFGTYGFGLCVLVDDSLHQITTSNGLKENVVSTITEDGRGNIWLTGNRGLTRIRKRELFAIIQGENTTLSAVIYNEESDALRSGEFNGGIQQSKFHLGGNRYIFPTLKGALVVDFDNMLENELAPNVLIEGIQYSDTTFDTYGRNDFDYTGERAEFLFTALSFVAPEKVKFKYQLLGYDKDWIDGGVERKAVYSKLPPGNYTFRVIASNDEDVWNLDGASYRFSIIPPYYMTWWFRSLLFVLAVFLTSAFVRYFVLRGQKIQRDKSAMLDILPDLVFKIDREGRYLDIYGNPAQLVAPAQDLKKRYIQEFLPQELAKNALVSIEKALDSQEVQQFNYDLKAQDGLIKNYEGRFIAIDKKEVLCIIRDTTDGRVAEEQIRSGEVKLRKALEKEKKLLKKINQQQKDQLAAIIDTEEKERKRIAADLHDGLGQLLSSVKINLGVASDKIRDKNLSETATLVAKSKAAIDSITSELRNISYNLLPPSIEQFGLASAMEEEVNKLSVDPNLKIYFDHSLKDLKFDQRLEVVVFRVFQELLNNALKHANATEITLQLIQHTKELVFMIEDNGQGFDYEKGLLKKDSSGLKNLQSRINLINGKIKIDSRIGAGTSVIIEIPI